VLKHLTGQSVLPTYKFYTKLKLLSQTKKKIQVLYSKLRPRGWYSYIPIFLAFYICKIYLYISFKTMWKSKSLALMGDTSKITAAEIESRARQMRDKLEGKV
jgi:hypothetical protein